MHRGTNMGAGSRGLKDTLKHRPTGTREQLMCDVVDTHVSRVRRACVCVIRIYLLTPQQQPHNNNHHHTTTLQLRLFLPWQTGGVDELLLVCDSVGVSTYPVVTLVCVCVCTECTR